MLTLPRFSFAARQHDPPNRAYRIARCVLGNGVEVTVSTNHPRTAWWIYALKDGFRRSNVVRTSSKRVAETWRAAVEAGEVEVE